MIRKWIKYGNWKCVYSEEVGKLLNKFDRGGEGIDICQEHCPLCQKETCHLQCFNEGGHNSTAMCLNCCETILQMTKLPEFQEYFKEQKKVEAENEIKKKSKENKVWSKKDEDNFLKDVSN